MQALDLERSRELAELREEFSASVLPGARDQYEQHAFAKIVELLSRMEEVYLGHALPGDDQQFAYLGRLVAESDPDVLPVELGGRLIKAERDYLKSRRS